MLFFSSFKTISQYWHRFLNLLLEVFPLSSFLCLYFHLICPIFSWFYSTVNFNSHTTVSSCILKFIKSQAYYRMFFNVFLRNRNYSIIYLFFINTITNFVVVILWIELITARSPDRDLCHWAKFPAFNTWNFKKIYTKTQ